jgi:hypothetical protein
LVKIIAVPAVPFTMEQNLRLLFQTLRTVFPMLFHCSAGPLPSFAENDRQASKTKSESLLRRQNERRILLRDSGTVEQWNSIEKIDLTSSEVRCFCRSTSAGTAGTASVLLSMERLG